jgi:RNA polymerase primary sigma factor
MCPPLNIEDRSLEIYLREISELPTLTSTEERALIRKAKGRDREAIERLIYAHLKFVVSLARHYQGYGVPLGDLINEGNLGLIKALKKFDPERKVRFLSYAIWWIRQSIMKALNEQSRLIRVSEDGRSKLKKMKKAVVELMHEIGGEPTFHQIAEELGLSVKEVKRTYQIVTIEVSLDAPIYPGENHTLLDITDQTALPSPEEAYESTERTDRLSKALDTLPAREKKILCLYFGLDEDKAFTLEEIGVKMGISRERVRQLKSRALKTMRRKYSYLLKDFIKK